MKIIQITGLSILLSSLTAFAQSAPGTSSTVIKIHAKNKSKAGTKSGAAAKVKLVLLTPKLDTQPAAKSRQLVGEVEAKDVTPSVPTPKLSPEVANVASALLHGAAKKDNTPAVELSVQEAMAAETNVDWESWLRDCVPRLQTDDVPASDDDVAAGVGFKYHFTKDGSISDAEFENVTEVSQDLSDYLDGEKSSTSCLEFPAGTHLKTVSLEYVLTTDELTDPTDEWYHNMAHHFNGVDNKGRANSANSADAPALSDDDASSAGHSHEVNVESNDTSDDAPADSDAN